MYSELDRDTDACQVTEKAIEIYRNLIVAGQPRYQADLARALSNLSAQLSTLDCHARAQRTRTEAAAIRRDIR